MRVARLALGAVNFFSTWRGRFKRRAPPLEKLTALLGQEAANSPRDREELELLFDYWAIGTRLPEVREKIRCALRRYREAFGRAVQEIFEQETDRFAFPGVAATELARTHGEHRRRLRYASGTRPRPDE